MDNDNFFTLSSKTQNDNYLDSSPSKNIDKSYADKYYQKKNKTHNMERAVKRLED